MLPYKQTMYSFNPNGITKLHSFDYVVSLVFDRAIDVINDFQLHNQFVLNTTAAMPRLKLNKHRKQKKLAALCVLWLHMLNMVSWYIQAVQTVISIRLDKCPPTTRYKMFYPERKEYMHRLVYESDDTCLNQLRMNRATFVILCNMLESNGNLKASKYVQVDEQVAIFLYVLAHHVKNRVAKFLFHRSGETISKHFNNVLNFVIRLQNELFEKPEPISDASTDERWKWFKGCFGAIDGTHINVQVPEEDKPRYRNRKGEITTNVLAACTPDMQFIYVLPGWEGSAADGRIIRSAMIRENGLQVPKGNYYLVDVGYTNGEGFLAPFRGQRYHLNTWLNGRKPEKPEEYFNMKHSAARNVIERCFGVLKKRWAILRSPSFYPTRTQNKIILACCLMHNFIRREMAYDPLDDEEFIDTNNDADDEDLGSHVEHITTIGTSNEWTNFRQNLATSMFNAWTTRHQ
ncbi:hypothetical protein QVD17_06836 [Tagetes erecta]|uniref:Protein ALP1-like n=1 Tax=Tagetes erecta TaxID=13708 RepID=A0AAD8P6W8_TARER|nr:hypothetical protein QVD17_06836 [Tagetes erecta]